MCLTRYFGRLIIYYLTTENALSSKIYLIQTQIKYIIQQQINTHFRNNIFVVIIEQVAALCQVAEVPGDHAAICKVLTSNIQDIDHCARVFGFRLLP